MWAGDDVKIQDEESWLEAVKSSQHITNAGAWFTLKHEDGSEEKFQRKNWTDKLQKEDFRESVLTIMDEDVIMKFKNREGNAQDFYDSDDPPAEK